MLLAFLEGGTLSMQIGGKQVELTQEDVQVERVVHAGMIASTQNQVTLALETELNEQLLAEGLAREIVNKINTMRREAQFDVVDRIRVTIDSTQKVQTAFELFKDYICNEVLADQIEFGPCSGMEWDLNGEQAIIAVRKA